MKMACLSMYALQLAGNRSRWLCFEYSVGYLFGYNGAAMTAEIGSADAGQLCDGQRSNRREELASLRQCLVSGKLKKYSSGTEEGRRMVVSAGGHVYHVYQAGYREGYRDGHRGESHCTEQARGGIEEGKDYEAEKTRDVDGMGCLPCPSEGGIRSI